MRYMKLYAGADGESHWQDVEIALEERVFAPPAKGIEVSAMEDVTKLAFLRLAPGWDEPIHPTPIRQKLVCLAGQVRVTASDGSVRDVGRGDVWHMEDTHGKGHHTCVTSAGAFEAMIVQY